MIGISSSLIWSKTLRELIFNPCGEVWRAQLVKSTHLTSRLVSLESFLSLRSVQDAKYSGVQKGMGSYRTYSISGKTAGFIPEFAVEELHMQ